MAGFLYLQVNDMNKKEKYEYYNFLFKLVLHESKAVWDTGQLFLLSNSFLAAIIGTSYKELLFDNDWNKKLIFWLLLLLGFLISILWYFSFERTKKYYHFRMLQARDWEKNNNQAGYFQIFSGKAEKLASGGVEKVDGELQDLKVHNINLSSLKIVKYIIILFCIFYFITLIISINLFTWKFDTNTSFHPVRVDQEIYSNLSFWNIIASVGAVITAVTASLGLWYVRKTWNLERKPVVHAVGSFFISKSKESNIPRDNLISSKESDHTLQLINVGRGPGRNVVPSISLNISGKLLEDSCPNSFSIPSNNGTKILGEILRVHGQRFISGNEFELRTDKNNNKFFYIHYEDHEGKKYSTEVEISKVIFADGVVGKMLKKYKNLELWKIMRNIDL